MYGWIDWLSERLDRDRGLTLTRTHYYIGIMDGYYSYLQRVGGQRGREISRRLRYASGGCVCGERERRYCGAARTREALDG